VQILRGRQGLPVDNEDNSYFFTKLIWNRALIIEGVRKSEGLNMRNSTRTLMRFPVGSKYVLEGRGPFVRRYVEFPDGRTVQLATRKALSCKCAAKQRISLVPDQSAAAISAPSLRKKLARILA
jgi:hypothetical protein